VEKKDKGSEWKGKRRKKKKREGRGGLQVTIGPRIILGIYCDKTKMI
jgi:hypothetical protein